MFLDIDELQDKDAKVTHKLPTEEQYLAHMRKIGVGDSKPVICYDNGENRWAARACFILQYWGFKA